MTSKRLGVGVIGLGVGEQHAAAFDRHPDCRLVALCDQDDVWHTDKLATLIDHLGESITLVYSDMNITDAQGRVSS